MMDRRDVLAMFGKATVAGAGRWLFKLKGSSLVSEPQSATPASGGAMPAAGGRTTAFDEHVAAEMKRLSTRVYSEEGIPMLLACENLVPAANGKPAMLPTTAFNKMFSSAFKRYAEAWQRLHADATDADVPKVLELLADLDFTQGGKEASL